MDQKTYICPMDPDVIKNSPGTCPKCGMDLQEVKVHSSDNKHNSME